MFGLPFYFLVIYSEESWPFVYLLVLSIFFFQFAHTLFTVQYLQTSLILPLSLQEAKLEWIHDASVSRGQY